MSSRFDAPPELVESLLLLVKENRPLPCDCLRSVQAHMVRAYDADGASISMPLRGRYRVKEGERWSEVGPGQILVVPNARSIDAEHVPDESFGEFVALSVELNDKLLGAARLVLPEGAHEEIGRVGAVSMGDIMPALTRWAEAMHIGHRALALHSMVEVIIRLYEAGHRGLLREQPPTLAMRIRRMVAAEPARPWDSPELEQSVGMSGASLRRHLAAEGTSMRTLVADARLAEALRLLLTTRLPVKAVAARVGYNSVQSFSKRFSDRYGGEPSTYGKRQEAN